MEELVDLVDSEGNIQKQSIPRDQVNSFPDLHMQIVIAVIFDSNNRVLVHQRAKTKKVNPGDVDHVCGGVMTGETPEQAAFRETVEETGVEPSELRVIKQGVNQYNRYRYLLVGKADTEPGEPDPNEAEWVKFMSIEDLKNSKELTFVDEFFEETELALSSKIGS